MQYKSVCWVHCRNGERMVALQLSHLSQFPKVLNKPNFVRLFAMCEGVGFVDETSFIVVKAFLQKRIAPLGKSWTKKKILTLFYPSDTPYLLDPIQMNRPYSSRVRSSGMFATNPRNYLKKIRLNRVKQTHTHTHTHTNTHAHHAKAIHSPIQ